MYYKIINKKKKIAVEIADICGYILWAPINIFRKRQRVLPLSDIHNILVVRTAYIGDVVMTLPILKPLKELFPQAKISFLTSSKASGVLENNPYIDEILTYDAFWFYPQASKTQFKQYLNFLKILRSKKYDLIIEARADMRDIILLTYLSKARFRVSYKVGGGGYLLTHTVPFKNIKHRVDYHLDIVRYLGAMVREIEYRIYLSPEEQASIRALLSQELDGQPELLVGIHPGARKELKCWDMEKFAKLADQLISENGAKVIFSGTSDERPLIDDAISKMKNKAINLAGRTDLRGLCALIDELDLFISNDTASLHIACALNTPTVGIFGPSKSRETGPYGNINRVVEKDFPCRFICDEDECHFPRYKECMKVIQVSDVLAAAQEVLDKISNQVDCYGI